MPQLLILLVVVLVLAAIAIGVTLLIRGTDPGLQPVEPDGRAVPLPVRRPLTERDVTDARFDVALRGYRMAQVDRALDRAAYDIGYKDELISVLEAEIEALRAGRTEEAEALRRIRLSAAGQPAAGEPADAAEPAGPVEVPEDRTTGPEPAGDATAGDAGAGPAGIGTAGATPGPVDGVAAAPGDAPVDGVAAAPADGQAAVQADEAGDGTPRGSGGSGSGASGSGASGSGASAEGAGDGPGDGHRGTSGPGPSIGADPEIGAAPPGAPEAPGRAGPRPAHPDQEAGGSPGHDGVVATAGNPRPSGVGGDPVPDAASAARTANR